MTYLEEMQETSREVRKRLGMWRPFEPVKWRRTPAPLSGEEQAAIAAREKRSTLRKAIIDKIERQRGIYAPQVVQAFPGRLILAETAAKYGLTLTEIKSRRRERRIVYARQEAAWRMTKETVLSLTQIALVCGGLDHTTIMHGVRRHEARVAGAS